MPSFDLVVESKVPRSGRCTQLQGMFDVPKLESIRHEWHVNLPIEDDDWNIGLIVGPSGCGKSQIARRAFGADALVPPAWSNAPVIDNFDPKIPIAEVAGACTSVGFNTIPSWMKPFGVLSNGEQFRVEIARRMLESAGTVVVDEFTSVVDRQVAKVACNSVQKFVRKTGRRFVAVTCHYDVIEWLRPDWIYDPSTQNFARGSLQHRRPAIEVTIGPLPRSAWKIFSPYHYMTADLHNAARCWGLWCDGRLAAFAGMIHNAGTTDIMRCSRLVTLPDFQGLGLAFVLIDAVGSFYKVIGKHVHTYPAHPSLIRGFDRSRSWALRKKPGRYSTSPGATSSISGKQGGRPCAVFRYVGDQADASDAKRLLSFWELPMRSRERQISNRPSLPV